MITQDTVTAIGPVLSDAIDVALAAFPEAALAAPLVQDAVAAALTYLSPTPDPVAAQAAFTAACQRYDDAIASWKAAETATPAPDAGQS